MKVSYRKELAKVAIILLILAICSTCNAQAISQKVELQNSTYRVIYDIASHVPTDVYWTLRASDFAISRKRAAKYFKADKRVPKPRVLNSHYINCGYMRGHMCPAADRTATKAIMKETFLMTNVAPMTSRLNCGIWSDIESWSRAQAIKYDSVKIHAAALFLCGDSIYIARGLVRVPNFFSKEVRVAKTDSLIGYWLISQNGDIITRVDPGTYYNLTR